MKALNLIKLPFLTFLLLTGQTSSLDSSDVAREHFLKLSEKVGDYLAEKHGTSVKEIDFTNSDKIHHGRWCRKNKIAMDKWQITIERVEGGELQSKGDGYEIILFQEKKPYDLKIKLH